jgi:hypothetical protein
MRDDVPADDLDGLRRMLLRENRFARAIRSMGDVDGPTATLVLRHNVATNELASFTLEEQGDDHVRARDIVFHRHSDAQSTFMNVGSAMYDTLQFPLLLSSRRIAPAPIFAADPLAVVRTTFLWLSAKASFHHVSWGARVRLIPRIAAPRIAELNGRQLHPGTLHRMLPIGLGHRLCPRAVDASLYVGLGRCTSLHLASQYNVMTC